MQDSIYAGIGEKNYRDALHMVGTIISEQEKARNKDAAKKAKVRRKELYGKAPCFGF